MLKATEQEIEQVREYFEWQAPDLEVTFMQKVYSEAVANTRHDVWDIHTNKDRWWVITGGTNLYSQEQFPNMDLALTFHIGLILRIPRTEEQQEDDLRILPFGPVFEKMAEAGTAVAQAPCPVSAWYERRVNPPSGGASANPVQRCSASIATTSIRAELSNWFTVEAPELGSTMACPGL